VLIISNFLSLKKDIECWCCTCCILLVTKKIVICYLYLFFLY